MENKSMFSQNLIKLRKQRGLTQTQLADKVGLTQRMITYYEKENGNPPLDKVEAIAKVLNVSIDELVGNKISKPNDIFSNLDPRTLKKLEEIVSLPKYQRLNIYALLETYISRRKKHDHNNEALA